MKTIKNKKGFGLVAAMMIILVLCIMAAGFFQVTRYSTNTTEASVRSLRLYWAAESASNYNVNWWLNQPEEVRVDFPSSFTVNSKTTYDDKDGPVAKTAAFSGAEGTTDENIIYLHRSCLFDGNTDVENPDLEGHNGEKLLIARYKGPRAGKPEQAVWILDSYAWDPNTGEIANIVLSNVYNIKPNPAQDLGWLDNAEAINRTMYGSGGFNGRKGVYYEWDFRYGQCYFNDLVRFDFKSGSSKVGPTFYGKYTTSTDKVSRYGSSVANPKLFTDLTTDYAYGIFAESTKIRSQAQAISNTGIGASLIGGYEIVEELPTEGVLWSWDEVVKEGPKNGFYFLPKDLFSAGDKINVEIKTKTVSGQVYTYADIWKNDNSAAILVKDLPINSTAQGFQAIAVEKIYGDVAIHGVSKDNFSLITESNNIHLDGDFYLHELTATKQWLESQSSASLDKPSAALLKTLYDAMNLNPETRPKGHLSLISCLGDDAAGSVKRENSFYITKEETMFLTAALISYNGDMSAAGGIGTSQNTNLKFFNVGSFIILDTAEETTGTNSGKYPFALVQDQRYLAEDEPLPPGWGVPPNDTETPGEALHGLNLNHNWSKPIHHTTKDWKTVVWRNI